MAFAGVHIACGYAGILGPRKTGYTSVINDTVWSESFPTGTAGTTTNIGPSSDTRGMAVVTISTATDIYFSVDRTPDVTTTGKRRLLRAGADETVGILDGERVAWVAT